MDMDCCREFWVVGLGDIYDIRWLCRRGWYLVAGSWFTMFGDVLTSTATSILLWCLSRGWSLRFGRGNQVVVASFVLLLWLYFFGFLLSQISLYSFELGLMGLVLDAVSLLWCYL